MTVEIKPGLKFEWDGETYTVLDVKAFFSPLSGLYVRAELRDASTGESSWYRINQIGDDYKAGMVKIID